MTKMQLLYQLNQQLKDLRYREQHAIAWKKQGEQNHLYALGALAVIQSQIDEITYLVQRIEYEGITDGQTSVLAENLRNRKTTPGIALDAIQPRLPHVADSYLLCYNYNYTELIET